MNQHACIKCNAQYQDIDPEPYLCGPCKVAKDAVALQVDKQMAGRPRVQVKSSMQQYDEAPKGPGGFMIVR